MNWATFAKALSKILGCTRQHIRNSIMKDDRRSLMPINEGTLFLWHLAEVLAWLKEAKMYSIDNSLLEIAKIKGSECFLTHYQQQLQVFRDLYGW
jgi:hypothetical protein